MRVPRPSCSPSVSSAMLKEPEASEAHTYLGEGARQGGWWHEYAHVTLVGGRYIAACTYR